ncbi:Gfo/Idh/MocA family oxidoreductase [Patescibacteria group bacterium]|nr:MAG: Gfo/Idh/MocA family oxidoreductase [Patescibacteria group bacterium]
MLGWVDHADYRKWQSRQAKGDLPPDFLSGLRVLVVGAGSIGKRHIGNLTALGIGNVAVVEPREDRRREAQERFGALPFFATEELAYAAGSYDAVVVANPPALHAASGERALLAGAHVLMEKSITDRVETAEHFLRLARRAGKVVAVNYVYRYADTLRTVAELLSRGEIGKIYSAQIVFSECLLDWHPGEHPRAWYAGHKDLGGGELSDENHAVDIARWLFGEVREVMAYVGRLGELTLDADDFAEVTLTHQNGIISQIHLDALGREPRKEMRIIGEAGSIFWDSYMGGNRVELFRAADRRREIFPGAMARNDYFVEQLRDFLLCVARGGRPLAGGDEALAALKICAAAERSSREGVRARL